MEEFAYFNGVMVPIEAAKIPVRDYGFLFGYGIFETMRAYHGTVFRLERHLIRLAGAAKRLGIDVDIDVLGAAVRDTVRTNRLEDARVRISLSIGEGSQTPDPMSCRTPTIVVLASQYVCYPPETYARGFSAIVSSIRRNSRSPLTGMKTANYLDNLLARQEARAGGADDALLLNDAGNVAEASASNLFLVEGGVLATPRSDSGILPGITREAALELAHQLKYAAVEADVSLHAVEAADEAFLTNSLMGIMPLTVLGGRPIGSGLPGDATRQLMNAYAAVALP